uniref:Innexin n=1 Tax=Meloidogyne floridensis TaxID=298350 RepID=A0A915PGQ2_9BILA
MNTIVETAVKIVGPVKVQLDDFVDRLCYKATSTLLFVFALLTTIDTFGKPINCMVPAEFTDVDFSHINSLCAKARTDEAANRTVHLDKAAKQIYQVAKHRGFHGIGLGAVTFYYIFKCFNMVVIFSQIIFLAVFCGKNDPLWGINV